MIKIADYNVTLQTRVALNPFKLQEDLNKEVRMKIYSLCPKKMECDINSCSMEAFDICPRKAYIKLTYNTSMKSSNKKTLISLYLMSPYTYEGPLLIALLQLQKELNYKLIKIIRMQDNLRIFDIRRGPLSTLAHSLRSTLSAQDNMIELQLLNALSDRDNVSKLLKMIMKLNPKVMKYVKIRSINVRVKPHPLYNDLMLVNLKAKMIISDNEKLHELINFFNDFRIRKIGLMCEKGYGYLLFRIIRSS